MPLPNPFRRQPKAPTLRERAAELKAGLSRAIRQPASEPAAAPEAVPADSLEDFAEIEFDAYALDEPLKTPTAWAARFSDYAVAMHVADRTVRMTKPELIAFIREAGEKDPETPAAMFHALDSGQKSLEGWGNLLGLARARYIVAASAEFVGGASADPVHEINPSGAPAPAFADQVVEAGGTGDVLAASGIDHRDGTVSYADATGKVVRRPMAHWIGFNAQQMHGRVRNEIHRRQVIEANHLPYEERVAWDAAIRCELRSDAVHALAFRHIRAFEAEQAFRSGIEPATQKDREAGDTELLALVPAWRAAVDLYQLRSSETQAVEAAADSDGRPGPAPSGSGPEWQAWFQRSAEWRERTGLEAAEKASGDACVALGEIEDRIAALPAASLAGLKLKAHVAQRHDDLELEWPDNLGAGLARDILAFVEQRSKAAQPKGIDLVSRIDFAAATMSDLLHIRSIAEHVGSTAYAHHQGGRCEAGRNALGFRLDNDLGKLMVSLGDALAEVESAADAEAKRRTPDSAGDRQTRLFMLTPPAIDNDDPDEIEAFALELLAYAAAERARG